MSFARPNYSIPVTSQTPSKSSQGAVYTTEDIETYTFDEENRIKSYAALGAAQKASTKTSEAVSIKGMVSVPVATNFTDSKKSMNELSGQKGDIAKVKDINLCGFLSDVPSLDLDITNFKPGGLPSLNEIMAGINGITLPTLQIASEAVTQVVGKIGDTLNQLGNDIQSQIPTISCKPREEPSAPKLPELGSDIRQQPDFEIDAFTIEPVPYGTDPNIIIDSPDVTVQSLNDTLDAGEFG